MAASPLSPHSQSLFASFSSEKEDPSVRNMTPLVTPAWLADHINAPDVVVFDASFYLPTEHANARARYLAGHIPGARFFDIEAIADPETDLPHMVPSAGRFARMLGELGVNAFDRIVFYDQKGLFSAARGWWLMRLFGHPNVYVLDGGLPAWVRAGYAVAGGQAVFAAAPLYPATLIAAHLRGIGDMLQNLGSHAELVLDARSAGRFAGTAPEPRPGLPGGHIPGAKSLPAGDLLNADQTMLSVADLRARFLAAGDDGNRPVITSCGTGVTAAILTLGRVVAGLPAGALYDGAWTEWASRVDTPKEV